MPAHHVAEHRVPTLSERRRLLLGAGLATCGLAAAWWGSGGAGGSSGLAPAFGVAQASPGDGQPFHVAVDALRLGAPVNRRLLGANVQWVDRGDDLLREDGSFVPKMLAQVQALGPTVLRFPGGAQSDLYHWQRGLGPVAERAPGEHFHARRAAASVMGTVEFLTLCAATGAEPLITVNVPSGTPEEAARWLHATNVVGLRGADGQPLPKVPSWEIGNEPYLKDEAQPQLAMEPEAFARKADATIRALRAVDPGIRIGLPVANQQRAGIPMVHFPDWLARVLGSLTERVDFAAVHDAYMPVVQFGDTTLEEAYWAAMASARSVQADLARLRQTLARLRPGLDLPLALTEYHAVFSLGRGARDEWTGSAAGALYVADLLRMLAQEPGMMMANLWSLSGNWRFGAIHSQGFARPVFDVLQLMNQALRGHLVSVATRAASVATPAAGLADAQPALPLVEALATREVSAQGQTWLRVLLQHKHPLQGARGTVHLEGAVVREARLTRLVAGEVMRADDVPQLMRREVLALEPAPQFSLSLPPASLSLLELRLDTVASVDSARTTRLARA
jgi:alpha-N-arabinofuranosidase